LQRISPDPELASTLTLAVCENDGPAYLLESAREALASLSIDEAQYPRVTLARALVDLRGADPTGARATIERLASESPALFEAVLSHSEILLRDGKVLHARRHLRRALAVAPGHPRLLSLLAESYLKSGTLYNSSYARQLATEACVASQWLSPREMHILAEAYYHSDDKLAALLIASKAKEAGSRLLGLYRDAKHLDALIESLSLQSLA
jgi:predicted Zn-dependent protease